MVPEVILVQVVPSDEVRMVPDLPTVTNNPVVVELSVVVGVDLLLLQEMMVKLKRRMERRMRVCFTWFPISGLEEPNIYHHLWDFTRIGEVSAENTKYAEHYISYGYSFRIYGDFEEILK